MYKVLIDNPDVRVLSVTYLPHATDLPHTDPRPGVSFVDRGPFEPRTATHFDREDQEVLLNDSDAPMQAIRVELKHPGCYLNPPANPAALDSSDAVLVAPGSHKILFEDQDFRVLDVTLPAHAKEPMHTHAWPSIMIPLQVVPMRYYTPTEFNPATVRNLPVTTLKAHELPPEGPHAVSNEGDTPGEFIRFELKHAIPINPAPAKPTTAAPTPTAAALSTAAKAPAPTGPSAPTPASPAPKAADTETASESPAPTHHHHRRHHKRHHKKSTTTPATSNPSANP